MALVKVIRHGQITLPAAFRTALKLEEGDFLEAELVEGRVVLRPATVLPRETTWRRLREAQAAVHFVGPEPRPDSDAEDELIHEEIAKQRADA